MNYFHDFLQLINENITMYRSVEKEFITPKIVKEKYGVHPFNFLLYKTLMGDSSDKVGGVKGLGKGKFDNNAVTFLPINIEQNLNHDFRVFDFNGDGLNDIIASSAVDYDNYDFIIYTQNNDGTFRLDKSKFIYNNRANNRGWKPWLIHFDFNNDGLKDISFIDNTNFNGELKTKTVFIRVGNEFIEKDFYQFDPYLNSIKPK